MIVLKGLVSVIVICLVIFAGDTNRYEDLDSLILVPGVAFQHLAGYRLGNMEALTETKNMLK